LSSKSDYKLWANKIELELERNNLKFLIDDSPIPERFKNWSKERLETLKVTVTSFIISHLDNEHHRYVMNRRKPYNIMNILNQKGNLQNRSAYHKARTKFYNLQFKKSETTVIEYLTMFDKLLKDVM
jgi:hypothetical protein